MKKVIKTADGIQIMTLVDGASFEEALAKWKDVTGYKDVSVRDFPDESIPTDREFRDAWDDTTAKKVIDIDMPKARDVHLERIRIKRNAELARLDLEMTIALGRGDEALRASIEEEKTTLRDLPAAIQSTLNAAKTVDDLKIIKPLG